MTVRETTSTATEERRAERRLAVIDCDVHHSPTRYPLDDALGSYVSERWRSYVETFGVRATAETSQIPAHRSVGKGAIARLDSIPPGGGEPGSVPDFAREQLLDRYGMTAAILNSFGGLGAAFGNMPVELGFELTRAENRWTHDHWLSTDPRWRASICVAFEHPQEAAAEIRRCRELDDRFVQVLLPSRSRMPIGNPHYWPIFEAAAEVDLPVAFHVGYCRSTRLTACGTPSYYFENHVDFALHPISVVPSLIFEGVLERWPSLKFVMVELGWAWAVPLAWRLDSAWRVLKSEVPHLKRAPSEYLRDHFWYTTQPMLQPTHDRWLVDVVDQFDRLGFGDKLLYSSDYPHWDFDAPEEALPPGVPRATRERVLARNAAALYGIPL